MSKAVVRRLKVLLAVITVSLSLQRAGICEATVPNDVRRLWLARLPRVCLIPLPMKLIASHGSSDCLFRQTHRGGTSGRLANRSLFYLGLTILPLALLHAASPRFSRWRERLGMTCISATAGRLPGGACKLTTASIRTFRPCLAHQRQLRESCTELLEPLHSSAVTS